MDDEIKAIDQNFQLSKLNGVKNYLDIKVEKDESSG